MKPWRYLLLSWHVHPMKLSYFPLHKSRAACGHSRHLAMEEAEEEEEEEGDDEATRTRILLAADTYILSGYTRLTS